MHRCQWAPITTVLYKAKILYDTWTLGGPPGCKFNVSDNGWMEKALFKDWFINVFIEHTKSLQGPKLLYLDGHKSHIDIDLSLLAIHHDVSIICLPPHSTHLLQPLDVAVFKTVKTAWRSIVQRFYEKNNFDQISKESFPALLKK